MARTHQVAVNGIGGMKDHDWRGAIVDLDTAQAAFKRGDEAPLIEWVRLYGDVVRDLMEKAS